MVIFDIPGLHLNFPRKESTATQTRRVWTLIFTVHVLSRRHGIPGSYHRVYDTTWSPHKHRVDTSVSDVPRRRSTFGHILGVMSNPYPNWPYCGKPLFSIKFQNKMSSESRSSVKISVPIPNNKAEFKKISPLFFIEFWI